MCNPSGVILGQGGCTFRSLRCTSRADFASSERHISRVPTQKHSIDVSAKDIFHWRAFILGTPINLISSALASCTRCPSCIPNRNLYRSVPLRHGRTPPPPRANASFSVWQDDSWASKTRANSRTLTFRHRMVVCKASCIQYTDGITSKGRLVDPTMLNFDSLMVSVGRESVPVLEKQRVYFMG